MMSVGTLSYIENFVYLGSMMAFSLDGHDIT